MTQSEGHGIHPYPVWAEQAQELLTPSNDVRDAQVEPIIEKASDYSQQLKQQENVIRLQAALIELAHDAIFVLDPQDHILSWNHGAEELYGWQEHEAIGRIPYDLLHTRPSQPRPQIEATQIQKGYWEGELVQQSRSGEQIISECRSVVIKDEQGEITAKLIVNRDITMRRQMELERKAVTALAADITGMGTWEWDLGTDTVEMNQACRMLFGLPHSNRVNYIDLLGVAYADDRAVIELAVQRLREEHGDYAVEHRVIWPDGSVHWLAARGRPFFDERGTLVRMIGIVVDISDRMRLTEAIDNERKRANNILNSITDAFLHFDKNWRCVYINQRALAIMHQTEEEVRNKTLWEIFPLTEGSKYEQIYRRAMENGEEAHFEVFYPLYNGWFACSLYPARDGLSIYYRDITDQKRAEENLRASEAKFRRLAESNIIGVVVMDHRGYIWEANQAVMDLLHYPRSEFVPGATNAKEFMPALGDEATRLAWRGMRDRGVTQVFEREIITRDGEHIPVLIAGARLEGSDCAIFFVLDISAQKEVEKQRDAFMSMTSHELRNPLAAIKGNLQLALRRMMQMGNVEAVLPSDASKNLQKMNFAIERAINQTDVEDRLISDLLDISRTTTQRLKLLKQRANLIDIVVHTFEDLQSSNPQRDLRLQLPDQPEIPVEVDVDRITQVINNYVTNAFKYADPEKPVLIEVRPRKHDVYVAVIDKGPGLTEEEQQRIWERFYQVKGAKSYGQAGMGLGLGLHISQTLISLHNGKVGVDSTPGKGSTFWFTLPLAEKQ